MKMTWHLLFGPVLFSAHVYGSSHLLCARSLNFTLFSKYLTIYFVLHFSNEYINKVFAGAWFRSNFEDLLSYRGANKLEWFEVLLGADCSPVPATGKSQFFFSNFLTGKTDEHRIIQENLQISKYKKEKKKNFFLSEKAEGFLKLLISTLF